MTSSHITREVFTIPRTPGELARYVRETYDYIAANEQLKEVARLHIGEKEFSPGSDWETHGRHDYFTAKKQLMLHLEFNEMAEEKIRPIKREVEYMLIQSKNLILSIAQHLMGSGELSYEDVKRIIDETPGPDSK